jgi:hypothetical protein
MEHAMTINGATVRVWDVLAQVWREGDAHVVVARHEQLLPTLSNTDRDTIRGAAAGSIDGLEARLDGVQALRLSDAWSYREEALSTRSVQRSAMAAAHARGNAVLAVRVLSGTIVRATEKAIQVEVYGQRNTTIWLPKSILMVEIPTDEHILSYYRSNGMLETPNFVLASWFRPDAWQSSVFARVEPEFLTA